MVVLCWCYLDIVMDVVDLAYYYLVLNLKHYTYELPKSATLVTRCKILNFDARGYLGIAISKGYAGNSIFPVIKKLNSSFSILPSSLSITKDFCLIEPRLYDESGKILFEMRKF